MQNPGRSQTKGLSLELFHVQTNTGFELPADFTVIRLGKPKEQFIPDIDVSGLPNADFVSRFHAEIQVEKSTYYIVDVGSSNGTYLNNVRIKPKTRYSLNFGDKIDLGHGNKVTFLFLNKEKLVFESDTKLNEPPTVIQIELFANAEPSQRERLSHLVGWVGKMLNESLHSLKKLLKK
ncbi:FHA domain-containing protein [Mastigocladopsis repens]|uniref:FHA domain-containing protein n=1 Tax=Mastigocladopsis repens TaxID=221287 RepID=UPI0002DC1F24